jgi:hypothetical protein
MAGAAMNRAMDVAHRATVAFLMAASVWTGVEIFRGITHLRAHNIAYVRRAPGAGRRCRRRGVHEPPPAAAAAARRAPLAQAPTATNLPSFLSRTHASDNETNRTPKSSRRGRMRRRRRPRRWPPSASGRELAGCR